MPPMSRRGVSVVEVLVVLAMAGILLLLGVQQGRPRSTAAQVESLAHLVSQALRQARQQALSSGRPTALCFPRGNGSQPLARSCYLAQGESRAEVVKIWNWASDTPQAALCAATYPGPSWDPVPPADPVAASLPPGWATPFPQDSYIAFLADGQVVSNRPWANDTLRLVVGSGFEFSNPSALELLHLREGREIIVSRWGAIELRGGLAEAAAGTEQPGLGLDEALLSPARSLAAGPNQVPTFAAAPQFSPGPSNPLPMIDADSHLTLTPDGLLTATVFGSDPDGDVLNCVWTAVGDVGTFSAPRLHRMRWNAEAGQWVGRWSWRPPVGALPGQEFQLECRLIDEHGAASAPLTLSAQIPRVHLIKPGRLVYEGDADLWTCNWDGSDPCVLVHHNQLGGVSPGHARWSPDGRRVAFLADDKIMCVNRDGTDLHVVRDTGGNNLRGLCWDEAGRYLYVLDYNAGNINVRVAPANGRDLPNPIPAVASGTVALGNWVFLHKHPEHDLWAVSGLTAPISSALLWGGSTTATVLPGIRELSFAPDGTRAIYDDMSLGQVCNIDVDFPGRNLTMHPPSALPPVAGGCTSLRFSPDLQYIHGQAALSKMFLMKADGSDYREINVPSLQCDSQDWSNR